MRPRRFADIPVQILAGAEQALLERFRDAATKTGFDEHRLKAVELGEAEVPWANTVRFVWEPSLDPGESARWRRTVALVLGRSRRRPRA